MQSRRRPLTFLLGVLALTVPACVSGFSDTSPYFLISSTSPIPKSARARSILSSSTFVDVASDVIARCDAEAYILVSQPGLHIEDVTASPYAAVHLKDLLSKEETGGWVAGNVFSPHSNMEDMLAAVETLQGVAVEKCDALVEGVDAKTGTFKPLDGVKPKVIRLDFDRLPSGKVRGKAVELHDAFLHSVMDMVPTQRYVIVFVSSPIGEVVEEVVASPPPPPKEETVMKAPALELRSVETRAKGNRTLGGEGGLFHRYQFFSPAIFMGYLVFAIMLVILYVAMSAVSSIEVSYGAFDKEMGPAAAKKTQ